MGDTIERILLDEDPDVYADVQVGEIMDLDNDGYSCGWYIDENDNNEYEQPFFFSPVDGGSAELLPLATALDSYDAGAALGLSPAGASTLRVVGWVEGSNGYHEAAYWTWDDQAESWSLNIVFTSATESEAQDVTDSGFIAGIEYDVGDPYIFIYNAALDQMDYQSPLESEAYAIRDGSNWVTSGTRVTSGGDQHASYLADGQSLEDLHDDLPGSTYDESIAYAMNVDDDVAGYAIYTTPGGPAYDPAYWWYDTQASSWDSRIFSVDNPDPVDAGVRDVSAADGNDWINIVGDYEKTYSDERGVFFVRQKQADGQADYWSYALDDTGSGGHPTLALYPSDAREGDAPKSYTGNAVNDNFWIGGSYSPEPPSSGAPSDYRPCLWIPIDVDNNGEPDIEEILDAEYADPNSSPDLNGNWLLDWAENNQSDGYSSSENMRVGLHAPGPASQPQGGLDPVQIVRIGINIKPRGEDPTAEIPDEEFIDEVVAEPSPDCTACETFTDKVDNWGTGDERSIDQQAEVMIRIHSLLGDEAGWGKHEGLPADATVESEALEDIRRFAWRFAYCLDWLQWGNESFGGARGYKIRSSDLTDGDCTWASGPKYFVDLKAVDVDCQQEAVQEILEWQEEQMHAARTGSALSGRPVRMTSCGINSGNVRNGYDAQNDPDHTGRYLTTEVSDWCNDNRAYFSMHVHYIDVDDAKEAMEKLIDTYTGAGAPWTVPDGRVATEVGARADFSHQWWTSGNFENLEEHQKYFFTGHGDPSDDWGPFVDGWTDDAGGPWDGDGPEFGQLFSGFDTAGFTAICYSALQYNTQSFSIPSQYLIEAIRATKVRPGFMSDPDEFSPLEGDYDSAGSQYKIDDFDPHDSACSDDVTCPECP